MKYCEHRHTPTQTHALDYWCSQKQCYVARAVCEGCSGSDIVITLTNPGNYVKDDEPVNRSERRLVKRGKKINRGLRQWPRKRRQNVSAERS